MQHYEGASTLYGPASAPLVQWELRKLAESLQTGSAPGAGTRNFEYRAGAQRYFHPRDGLRGAKPSEDFANIEIDQMGNSLSAELPRFCWREVPVSMGDIAERANVTLPSVQIQGRASESSEWVPFVRNGLPENDEGEGLLVYLLSVDDAEANWCASWLNFRIFLASEKGWQYRFRVRTTAGVMVDSAPF